MTYREDEQIDAIQDISQSMFQDLVFRIRETELVSKKDKPLLLTQITGMLVTLIIQDLVKKENREMFLNNFMESILNNLKRNY